MQAILKSTGAPVAEVETAYTFWKRFLGLQFRGRLEPGRGLHINPCDSIHMFFMRFPIDAIFLARDGRITLIRAHLRPWTGMVLSAPGAQSVLEMEAGSAERLGLAEGDFVEMID